MSITVEVPWDCFKSDGVLEYAMWIDLFIVDAVVDTEEGEESELVRAGTGVGFRLDWLRTRSFQCRRK
jgi:hypothetical protein